MTQLQRASAVKQKLILSPRSLTSFVHPSNILGNKLFSWGVGSLDFGENYWRRDCLVQIYSCLSKNKDKIML